MKKIYLLALLALMAQPVFAQNENKIGLDIRVATSNVRYATKSDGVNCWENRRERLAKALNYIEADVIGTQEALDYQKNYLAKQLKGYKVVGAGRDDGKNKGEHSAIYYNSRRFKALDCGNFWLSETPDVPSKGWDAACVRIASWAFLEEKTTGKKFFFVNTHLDHVGVVARREGVALLCRKAAEIGNGCPTVITGDFNIYKESEDIEYIKNLGLIHAYDIAESTELQPATWHGYESDKQAHVERVIAEQQAKSGITAEAPQIIDYIFISQGTCSYYEIMAPKGPDGGFLSDHSPVFADITL